VEFDGLCRELLGGRFLEDAVWFARVQAESVQRGARGEARLGQG